MKNLFILAVLFINFAYADCNFIYVNKSSYPITLQGYYLADGDVMTGDNWKTILPNSESIQIRKGHACNDSYNYGNKDITEVVLKNHSGYWTANKAAFSIIDKSLPHTMDDTDSATLALSDDRSLVVLSRNIPVSNNNFKVVICNPSKMDGDCS